MYPYRYRYVYIPVLARTGKLGNALQYNWKFKLAASKKTDIVKCSSRCLDFDVQGSLIFCWALAAEAMPKPNKKHETSYQNSTKMHVKFTQNPLKMDPWRALGPLWAQLAFQGVSQGNLFAHLGTLWAPLGTLWGQLGSTLEHFGVPRLSFWSPLGTMWHHLGDFGQLVKIAILWWEYCNLDHFGEPWDVTFLFTKMN